ncbi:hypothetical protein [Stomatohabitans albus]|uniref:hypothetical protein n=1 Tax=Stomatohabitans albus TaxID=3110766 RepID=UPI00300C5EBF
MQKELLVLFTASSLVGGAMPGGAQDRVRVSANKLRTRAHLDWVDALNIVAFSGRGATQEPSQPITSDAPDLVLTNDIPPMG